MAVHPIYVDMDDVITATVKSFIEIVEREFGKTVANEQITDFDLKKSFSLTQHEYEHLFTVAHEPEEVLKMGAIDGAVDALTAWSKRGFSISIVTGRLTSTYESSLEWLVKHQVPYDDFIMVDKYDRPEMDPSIAISKEQLAGMIFSLAVEDSAAMATFLSNHMDTPVALLDRPWNRNIEPNVNLSRYQHWNELSDIQIG
jgi:uncharacterized HAD superfamily protein